MPVNIHGKDYKTVAERLEEAKSVIKSITTEVLFLEPQVMVRATVVTDKGTFTGISAADPKKPIEARTPVEVAETSSVGRALAFAGYAGSEIASFEEMQKASIQSGLTMPCKIHNVMMKESVSKKTGRPFFAHRTEDGEICFGKA